MMTRLIFAGLLALAVPAFAQDAGSRLLDRPLPQVGGDARLRNQSEFRQREWQGARRPEYRRRADREGRPAADAWLRGEALRFDLQQQRRLRQ